jgi:nitrate reductase NapAB chaperone NapD
VVVASWIVTVAPDRLEEARARLGALPGARLGVGSGGREAGTAPIVVSTECGDAEMGRVQERLAGIPGVVSVAMVVAYRDDDTEVPR